MFKVGDRIYCFVELEEPNIDSNEWHITISPGIYTIKDILNFSFHDYYILYEIPGRYHNSYFMSIKDVRKIKLNKLCLNQVIK